MIRILHVIATLDPHGAERQLTALCAGLDRSAFELMVCCLTRGGPLEAELAAAGVPVWILGKRGKFDVSVAPKLIGLMRRLRPDVTHTWLFTSNLWGRVCAVLSGARAIVASERAADVWKTPAHRLADRLLARVSDLVLANSEGVRRFYVERVGIPREKLLVVRNGLDLARFDAEMAAGLSSPAPCAGEGQVIAAVARMEEQKGHAYLLRAFAGLRGSGRSCRLWLAGDGPLRPSLERLGRDLGVDEAVDFLGYRPDVPALVAAADLVVLPSLWEGLPNILIEAMAASRAVVATDVDGSPEVVADGRTGLLVPPRDPGRLADAMGRLLDEDSLRRRMGAAGRRRVEREFTLARTIGRMEEVYRALAGRRMGAPRGLRAGSLRSPADSRSLSAVRGRDETAAVDVERASEAERLPEHCADDAAPDAGRALAKGRATRRWLWTAGALFLLALAPRLGLALSLPGDDTVFVDRPYVEYARNFSEGRGFWCSGPYEGLPLDRVYAYRPPLFPFLWGVFYGVTGGAYAPIRAAHAVLTALACVAAWGVGLELFRDRRTAFLGACMVALYPPLIWHSVHLMTEPLFILFTTLTLLALLRARREKGLRCAAAAGAAIGLATLTRSVMSGFIPVAGVWLWAARGRGRRAMGATALFWGVAGVVMAPWVIRNAVVLKRFVPSTTDFGHGFYVANNGRSLRDPRGFHIPRSWDAVVRERPDERLDDEVEISRRLAKRAFGYVWRRKVVWVKLMAKRFVTFWRPWPNPTFVRSRLKVIVYGASFVPCFLLMIPGFVMAWRRGEERWGRWLILLLVGYMVAIHTAVLAMMRYRVPLMPALLMYSAFALTALWDAAKSRRASGGKGDPLDVARHFDGVAESYDEALPAHVQEHYLNKRAQVLRALAGDGECLDVGCGTGRLLASVSGGLGVGADVSAGMLRALRREGRGKGVRAAAEALPFADGRFDLVWSVATLHHLGTPERVAGAIREMVRVTRPGGWTVIWDHNPLNPYWPVVMGRVPQDSGDERLAPASEIAAALRSAGVAEWRLSRSGWVPDFAPKALMGAFAAAEAVLESVPGLRRFGAHNVFTLRKA